MVILLIEHATKNFGAYLFRCTLEAKPASFIISFVDKSYLYHKYILELNVSAYEFQVYVMISRETPMSSTLSCQNEVRHAKGSVSLFVKVTSLKDSEFRQFFHYLTIKKRKRGINFPLIGS